MTREALGEFEHMVLLAILHLGDGVYGVPIVDEIQRRTGRTVAPAAVYITLRRLEQKGLLTAWMSDCHTRARRQVAPLREDRPAPAWKSCASRANCSTACGKVWTKLRGAQ